MRLVVALLVLSCAPATTAAGVRRVAGAKLEQCLSGCVVEEQRSRCRLEATFYCRSLGLERHCAEDFEWRPERR